MVQILFKKRDFKYNKAKNAGVLKDLNFSSHNMSKKQKVFEAFKKVADNGITGSEARSAATFLKEKGGLSRKDAAKVVDFMRSKGYKGKNYSYKGLDKFETANNPVDTHNQEPRPVEKRVYSQRDARGTMGQAFGQRPVLNPSAPVNRINNSIKAAPIKSGALKLSPSFTRFSGRKPF